MKKTLHYAAYIIATLSLAIIIPFAFCLIVDLGTLAISNFAQKDFQSTHLTANFKGFIASKLLTSAQKSGYKNPNFVLVTADEHKAFQAAEEELVTAKKQIVSLQEAGKSSLSGEQRVALLGGKGNFSEKANQEAWKALLAEGWKQSTVVAERSRLVEAEKARLQEQAKIEQQKLENKLKAANLEKQQALVDKHQEKVDKAVEKALAVRGTEAQQKLQKLQAQVAKLKPEAEKVAGLQAQKSVSVDPTNSQEYTTLLAETQRLRQENQELKGQQTDVIPEEKVVRIVPEETGSKNNSGIISEEKIVPDSAIVIEPHPSKMVEVIVNKEPLVSSEAGVRHEGLMRKSLFTRLGLIPSQESLRNDAIDLLQGGGATNK